MRKVLIGLPVALFLSVLFVVPSRTARAGEPAGEFLFWFSNNSYSMTEFNAKLHDPSYYDWNASDPTLTQGFGLGMEFCMRFGRTITSGFGFSGEFLFASVSKAWPTAYYLDSYGNSHWSTFTESFDFMAGTGLVKYSGSAAIARMFSINWGLGIGVGGLIPSYNHSRVFGSVYIRNDHFSYTPGLGNVIEADVGPTLYLPGPAGFVLALRFGYRSFTLGPNIRWTDTYDSTNTGKLDYSIDYSGPFFRLAIGFGNVGPRFQKKVAPAKRRKDSQEEEAPQAPPAPF